jgi:hypothetical protein
MTAGLEPPLRDDRQKDKQRLSLLVGRFEQYG